MIIKRGNRYGVRIYVAKRQVWVGTFRTRQEARLAEREALMRVRPANDETVAEFVERWLRDFKRPRASTNRHNAYMVKPLVAELGSVKMSDLSRRRAREWALRPPCAAFRSCARCSTMRLTRSASPAIPSPTCAWTSGAVGATSSRSPRARSASWPTQRSACSGTYGPTFRACILFAAYVGLRPAELFVLEWSDIDYGRQPGPYQSVARQHGER